MEHTYKIPTDNLAALVERITKLNKKATKLGMPPITITTSEQKFETKEGSIVPDVYFDVTLRGEQPKLNGWSFAGTINHMDEGNIVRPLPGVTLAAKYDTIEAWCDHCQVRRKRNDSFIVRHLDTSEKMVGRSCLADFLGHENPHALAKYAELLAIAVEATQAARKKSVTDADLHDGTVHKDAIPYLDLKTYMAVVAACIREKGFVSRGEAWRTGGALRATADIAFDRLFDKTAAQPSVGDVALVLQAINWAEELEPSSDYESQVHVVVGAGSGACTPKQIGLVASVVAVFIRQKEDAMARINAPDTSGSKHFGQPGVKGTWNMMLLEKFPYGRRGGGSGFVLKFTTKEGNIATVFASMNVGNKLNKGSIYNIIAKVDKHSVYRGSAETVLKYAEVETVPVQSFDTQESDA